MAAYDSWQHVAEPYLARYAAPSDEEPPFGVGYLEVEDAHHHYYDWARDIVLPLWTEPDLETFYGWIHSGHVHPLRPVDPHPLTGAGLVETAYEFSSFIVYEAPDGGWLRIRIKPGEGGEVWTHRCHLALGEATLSYHRWESFLREHGDWLHFRTQVPHNLRSEPDVNSPRITMIGLDHKLILREIRGDWMRVTVEQPDQTCNGGSEQGSGPSTHDGWVKWRDDEKGPWIWVYTRGC